MKIAFTPKFLYLIPIHIVPGTQDMDRQDITISANTAMIYHSRPEKSGSWYTGYGQTRHNYLC